MRFITLSSALSCALLSACTAPGEKPPVDAGLSHPDDSLADTASADTASADTADLAAPVDPLTTLDVVPADTMISLQRQNGFFGCTPSFVVEVDANGVLSFDGRDNVALIGTDEGEVPTSTVLELLHAAGSVGFSSIEMEDDVEIPPSVSCGSDAYSVTTTIQADGNRTRVNRYDGCDRTPLRETLIGLEDRIDEALVLPQWRLPRDEWTCDGV